LEVNVEAAGPPDITDKALAEKDNSVPIQFQLDVRISDKKQISLTTYVLRECPDEKINEVLDKLARGAQRLQWANELEELERSIAHLTKQYANLLEDRRTKDEEYRARWEDTGRRGSYKPSGNEAKYLQDNAGMQERHRTEIETMETQRTRILEKLNGNRP
jgi:hypothetical protein